MPFMQKIIIENTTVHINRSMLWIIALTRRWDTVVVCIISSNKNKTRARRVANKASSQIEKTAIVDHALSRGGIHSQKNTSIGSVATTLASCAYTKARKLYTWKLFCIVGVGSSLKKTFRVCTSKKAKLVLKINLKKKSFKSSFIALRSLSLWLKGKERIGHSC